VVKRDSSKKKEGGKERDGIQILSNRKKKIKDACVCVGLKPGKGEGKIQHREGERSRKSSRENENVMRGDTVRYRGGKTRQQGTKKMGGEENGGADPL